MKEKNKGNGNGKWERIFLDDRGQQENSCNPLKYLADLITFIKFY
jgi:hypothetical protein